MITHGITCTDSQTAPWKSVSLSLDTHTHTKSSGSSWKCVLWKNCTCMSIFLQQKYTYFSILFSGEVFKVISYLHGSFIFQWLKAACRKSSSSNKTTSRVFLFCLQFLIFFRCDYYKQSERFTKKTVLWKGDGSSKQNKKNESENLKGLISFVLQKKHIFI